MNTTNKTLDSIADMAARLTGDPGMADMVREEASKNAMCNDLARMRMETGLSQRALAKKMGVSASTVCRIESGPDAALTVGDLAKYAKALNCHITLGVNRPKRTIAERIKEHIFGVHELLGELADMAKAVGAGDQIAQGINKFYGEVLFNFLLRFGESAEKLPRMELDAMTEQQDATAPTSMTNTPQMAFA